MQSPASGPHSWASHKHSLSFTKYYWLLKGKKREKLSQKESRICYSYRFKVKSWKLSSMTCWFANFRSSALSGIHWRRLKKVYTTETKVVTPSFKFLNKVIPSINAVVYLPTSCPGPSHGLTVPVYSQLPPPVYANDAPTAAHPGPHHLQGLRHGLLGPGPGLH